MSPDTFPVIEMFGPTIQGEGKLCGQATYFIRLGGCDYKCKMCDSKHAVEPEEIKKNATYLTAAEIHTKLRELAKDNSVRWVTISGGNPCMWDISELIALLQADDFDIAVETQGTIWQDWLLNCDLVTVSPKGPGMGESFFEPYYRKYVQKLIQPSYKGEIFPDVCLKIVVFDEADLAFAKDVFNLTDCSELPLYLSLGNSSLPGSDISFAAHVVELSSRYQQIASRLYADKILSKAIFLPQLHVLIWSNEQGV